MKVKESNAESSFPSDKSMVRFGLFLVKYKNV